MLFCLFVLWYRYVPCFLIGYRRLVEAEGSSVIKTLPTLGGIKMRVPIHQFAWDIFKAIHELSDDEVDTWVIRMHSEVKKVSFNPSGRHCAKPLSRWIRKG